MKKTRKILIATGALAVILIAAAYYYIALPAINIHSPGFWKFILFMMILITVIYFLINGKADTYYTDVKGKSIKHIRADFKSKAAGIIFKILAGVTILLVVIFVIGSILSSKIVNASKYQKLLNIEERSFTDDIKEVSYDQIPILDSESSKTIGNRVMGTMVDMVSQYEVSNDMYTQINYKNKPVRVAPLEYGDIIKWFNNNSSGIPAYIRIDMTTQEAECVRLSEGIKYSNSDHFGRNIYRHLRFAYPTYIFDDINFEIDENGTPYWICPVKKYNIGLFGGTTVGRVVICNAITGELQDYDVKDVPEWVDRVYSADMLVQLYDYYGSLKHGYINSVFGQKDCLKTTDGYNYIALDDDVWVYTGITSVGQDKSNVGFVLMNQRTMETRYYVVSGAEENSAMSSAEGKVQNLGYKATFPLLINVAGEPTYFMALKDSAGLVKCYAMLNIEKYQTVAIGDSVSDCEKNYRKLLADNGITKQQEIKTNSIKGTVSKITEAVIDGNSHYYILLDGSDKIFDVTVKNNISVIKCEQGCNVTIEYEDGQDVYNVTKIDIDK